MTKGRTALPGTVVAEQESPKSRPRNADLSTTLPLISCGDPWLWGSACGSLYGEPHKWTSLAARSRKSGYAPVEMTKGRTALPGTVVAEQESPKSRPRNAELSTTLRIRLDDT